MFNLLLVKRNIGKRLIGNELLFPGIFSGQVEVGMPGAGSEIDLCAFPIVIVEGDCLMVMGMPVDYVPRRVVQKGRFIQCELGEGPVMACACLALNEENQAVKLLGSNGLR